MLLLDCKHFWFATMLLEIFFSHSESVFVLIWFVSILLQYFFLLGVSSFPHFLKESTAFLTLHLNKLGKRSYFIFPHKGVPVLPLKSCWTTSIVSGLLHFSDVRTSKSLQVWSQQCFMQSHYCWKYFPRCRLRDHLIFSRIHDIHDPQSPYSPKSFSSPLILLIGEFPKSSRDYFSFRYPNNSGLCNFTRLLFLVLYLS